MFRKITKFFAVALIALSISNIANSKSLYFLKLTYN